MKKLLLILALLSGLAFGQGVLMPMPTQQFFDNSGNPLNGGLVYTYSSGTSTPLATYTDFSGLVQNQNPVVLDSAGYPSNGPSRVGIWLQAGQTYRIKLCSALPSPCSTQYWVMDGITGILTGLASTVSANSTVPYSASPTFTALAQIHLFKTTLTGNVTSSTLVMTGLAIPAMACWEWTQDSGGSHTVVYPTNVTGGDAVSATPNSVTRQCFLWNGTTAVAVAYANVGGRTLTPPAATDTLVGRASTDTLSNKTLTGANSNNAVTKLYSEALTAAITGTGTDKTVYTYTIPANTLTSGSGIRVTSLLKHATGSSTISPKLWFGGTAAFTIGSFTAAHVWNMDAVIMNNPGSTTAQTVMAKASFGSVGTAILAVPVNNTTAIDTTQDVIVKITFSAAGTETVSGQGFLVELIQ